MKIAIQGHPTRGHEIIQILESLGGKNDCPLTGTDKDFYYYIHNDFHKRICCHYTDYVDKCKKYTLEEFEKEFPFKVGDKVITNEGCIGIVEKLIPEYISAYCVKVNDVNYWCTRAVLRLYKEMKEERNITLTLDKAKEWYKKGGELKEIALQAFSEKELTKVELPKTWEEFCENYPVKKGESWLGIQDTINVCNQDLQPRYYKNWTPSKKSAEAHLALIQLEQLRDCWRQGWKPDWQNTNERKYAISICKNEGSIEILYITQAFLSFPTYELALEFQECFRDLIEKAGDLI